jgi:V/A-type H+/Na+-transporting ATPase subunit K
MISKRLARWTTAGVAAVGLVLVPTVAFAQEAAPAAAVDWRTAVGKAMAAAIAMAVSAFAAGYAQAKIGAAGAGTLAERPEAATMVIVLQALPEVIVLLGFVIAFMIRS